MRLFSCNKCQSPTFFENRACLSCKSLLAYDPVQQVMLAFDESDREQSLSSESEADASSALALCANRETAAACNWLADTERSDGFCSACCLTSVYPSQKTEVGRLGWSLSEQAKRRWLFTILQMGLRALPKTPQYQEGITFRILEPGKDKTSVLTGHSNGVITINAAESDPVERLARRTALEEPYRTLIGHFRHESGHYYWQLLIGSNEELLSQFREIFGDERVDYAQSLEAHYSQTSPDSWDPAFISHYAASHPWEDFAETWAHYMHICDALDLAQSWGLALPNYPQREIDDFAAQASEESGFRPILKRFLPVSLFANSLNRCLGHDDAYPFAPSVQVISKLAWVHRLVEQSRASTQQE